MRANAPIGMTCDPNGAPIECSGSDYCTLTQLDRPLAATRQAGSAPVDNCTVTDTRDVR
jgi:hypothetical protein